MATVTKFVEGVQHQKRVKNLSWFFRHAREVTIDRFDLWQANDGWEMFADFADGNVFHSHYASDLVFRSTMGRQRSLRGYTVNIHHNSGEIEHFKIGGKR